MRLKYFTRLNKLLKISLEALFNSFRLHCDSYILYKNRSYSTSFVISILALEEFGKFLIYLDLVWNRAVGQGEIPSDYLKIHEKFLRETMGSHQRKLEAVLWRHFGPSPKKGIERVFSKLHNQKLSALYVGVNDKNGKVVLPKRFSHTRIKAQILLLNKEVFMYISNGVKNKWLDYDIPAANHFFVRILPKLLKIQKDLQ